MIEEGTDVAILSFGAHLFECQVAADMLADDGISVTIADARFAKPLDREMILDLAERHEALITVEEGAIGGFGSHVSHVLAEAKAQGAFDTQTLEGVEAFLTDPRSWQEAHRK